MFFVLMMCLVNYYYSTLLVFQQERSVFLREQANKMYRILPYYQAKVQSTD